MTQGLITIASGTQQQKTWLAFIAAQRQRKKNGEDEEKGNGKTKEIFGGGRPECRLAWLLSLQAEEGVGERRYDLTTAGGAYDLGA